MEIIIIIIMIFIMIIIMIIIISIMIINLSRLWNGMGPKNSKNESQKALNHVLTF